MKKHNRALLSVAIVALLSACDNGAAVDPQKQMGPNPELPQAQNFLLPPM